MEIASVLRQRRVVHFNAVTEIVRVIVGALALTLSARISIPLYPVPVTAQTLVVLLLGAREGPVRGTLSVATYLLAGISGAPVFAAGGGLAYLLGPTGGYLLGFLPGAWIVGTLSNLGWRKGDWRVLGMLLLGDTVLFGTGLLWLAGFVPTDKLLLAGLLPFIPGEMLKIFVAGIVICRGEKGTEKGDRLLFGALRDNSGLPESRPSLRENTFIRRPKK